MEPFDTSAVQPGPPNPGATVIGQPTPGGPMASAIPEDQPATGVPAPTTPQAPAMSAQQPQAQGSGRSWSEMRRSYFANLARAANGNLSQYVAGREHFAEMERDKISRHLQGALFAAGQGDQAGAAAQLQAAGTYMFPSVNSTVSPGPEGSFIVENSDAGTGVSIGGYAVMPQNILEMVTMLQDPATYMEFAWNREVDRAQHEIRLRAEARAVQEHEMNMDIGAAEERRIRLEIAHETALQGSRLRASEAGAIKAESDALVALQTQDAQVSSAISAADSAEIAASKERDEYVAGRTNYVWNNLLDMRGLTDPEGADNLLPAQDGASDPYLTSPFHTVDPETGHVSENPAVKDLVGDLVHIFVRNKPDIDPNQLTLAIDGLLIRDQTKIQFFENKVVINTDVFPMAPDDLNRLRDWVMNSRLGAMARAGRPEEEIAQYLSEDGMTFNSLHGYTQPAPMADPINTHSSALGGQGHPMAPEQQDERDAGLMQNPAGGAIPEEDANPFAPTDTPTVAGMRVSDDLDRADRGRGSRRRSHRMDD